MDIGQPKDYLLAQQLYIYSCEESKDSQKDQLTKGFKDSSVIIHPSAKVDPSAQLGPNVVIGENCTIWAGVRIANSTIFGGTEVKPFTLIQGSIIGWKNRIGSWVRITQLVCTAEDVQVSDEACLTGTKVLPHKGVAGVHADVVLM